MDMVNDDKDIRLDTAEEVKKALLSGADLYNTETGEFWWLYNATDSIATATIHLDDPNLLAVVDNPDFDLYEVTVDGHDYEIMKGATYEDSRKVDDLLDSHGDKPISDYRKRPQGMSLRQAVREAREASAKLAEENGGTDDPDGKDER